MLRFINYERITNNEIRLQKSSIAATCRLFFGKETDFHEEGSWAPIFLSAKSSHFFLLLH